MCGARSADYAIISAEKRIDYEFKDTNYSVHMVSPSSKWLEAPVSALGCPVVSPKGAAVKGALAPSPLESVINEVPAGRQRTSAFCAKAKLDRQVYSYNRGSARGLSLILFKPSRKDE